MTVTITLAVAPNRPLADSPAGRPVERRREGGRRPFLIYDLPINIILFGSPAPTVFALPPRPLSSTLPRGDFCGDGGEGALDRYDRRGGRARVRIHVITASCNRWRWVRVVGGVVGPIRHSAPRQMDLELHSKRTEPSLPPPLVVAHDPPKRGRPSAVRASCSLSLYPFPDFERVPFGYPHPRKTMADTAPETRVELPIRSLATRLSPPFACRCCFCLLSGFNSWRLSPV